MFYLGILKFQKIEKNGFTPPYMVQWLIKYINNNKIQGYELMF